MKIYKEVNKPVNVIDDILCNNCGSSLKSENNFCGLLEANVEGCYDSPHLDDESTYSFSLCEKCLIDLMKNFKIPCNTSK